MTDYFTMSEMVDLAALAEQPVNAFIKAAGVLEQHRNAQQEARRATVEDKASITAYLESHTISNDLSAADILAGAGVDKKQGTSSFATRELKRQLALTHASTVRKAA
jgi:hypothetical protein